MLHLAHALDAAVLLTRNLLVFTLCNTRVTAQMVSHVSCDSQVGRTHAHGMEGMGLGGGGGGGGPLNVQWG